MCFLMFRNQEKWCPTFLIRDAMIISTCTTRCVGCSTRKSVFLTQPIHMAHPWSMSSKFEPQRANKSRLTFFLPTLPVTHNPVVYFLVLFWGNKNTSNCSVNPSCDYSRFFLHIASESRKNPEGTQKVVSKGYFYSVISVKVICENVCSEVEKK